MAIYGEYEYRNYTLLNVLQKNENLKSTSYHEYTHLILTGCSSIGMMIYCLEKIKIPRDSMEDQKKYNTLTNFLNIHTDKVQEGLAVFNEFIMDLINEGNDVCKKNLQMLKNNNSKYYRYVEPLVFIIRILKDEDKKTIEYIAHLVFLLGIESMNCKIYELDPEEFSSNKKIQKIISSKNFGKMYLPDKRFISYIKHCKMEQIKTAKGVEEYILPLLSQETINDDIEDRRNKLIKIKEFIIEFFGHSEYINAYKNKLNKVMIEEVNLKDLYLQQLPTIFNEEEIEKIEKKATTEEVIEEIKKITTMVFLPGSLKRNFEFIKDKMGLTQEWKYDEYYFKTHDLLMTFELKDKRVLMLLEKIDIVQKILSDSDRKAVIVASYKNYNYDNDSIIDHDFSNERIFIYCDRTYLNTKIYLDKWKGRKVYCNTMIYGNMKVLIMKIANNRYFLLPMTSIVAKEAYLDIMQTYKNIECTLKDGCIYDDQVIVDEEIKYQIDIIINCLFFITMKN